MKRILIAFGVLFLLHSMFGGTFDVYCDEKGRDSLVKIYDLHDTYIDRFDSCSVFSHFLFFWLLTSISKQSSQGSHEIS